MFVKLITIIFFFVSLLSQLQKFSSQSLYNFTYNGFYPPLTANITLQGIATVTPTGLLKLTNSTKDETGHAFYNQPLRFKDSPNGPVSSFSTTFVFAIDAEFKTLSGHGFAFVVAPIFVLPEFNSSSGLLGLSNPNIAHNETFHIFGVELKTIQNTGYTDMNDNTIDIDVNGLYPVKSSRAGYWDETGQFKNLTLNSGGRMQVWVDYDGVTNQINVTMAPFNHDKPIKPLVSTVWDLAPVLLQDMFVAEGEGSPVSLTKTSKISRVAVQDKRNLTVYVRFYFSVSSPYVYRFAHLPCVLHIKGEEKVFGEAGRLGNRIQEEPTEVQRLVLCHQRIQ
ncbi:unnamed protein product [Eruca vesicaria subsp. sativa]|uniref:Legume lectin domain-containing protein n=1 Tax=Eruca vesicaria subsp. sativa TaxID=29727 RepID=A0ABC8K2D6_ERUVS|nr:unnamed protein product [Eruca vesicaria subsp. sativa]